jgi:hypothetical protein
MVLPARSVTAENCTVPPTTTEGMLGEIATVAACNVLAAMSMSANEITTVSNLRIFERPPDRKTANSLRKGYAPWTIRGAESRVGAPAPTGCFQMRPIQTKFRVEGYGNRCGYVTWHDRVNPGPMHQRNFVRRDTPIGVSPLSGANS